MTPNQYGKLHDKWNFNFLFKENNSRNSHEVQIFAKGPIAMIVIVLVQ